MAFLARVKGWFGMNPEPAQDVKKATAPKRAALMSALAVFAIPLAIGLCVMAQPASAVAINLSVITDVINAFTGIIEPITSLLIAIVPLWFIMQILAFIMGLLAAILGMIKFGRMNH